MRKSRLLPGKNLGELHIITADRLSIILAYAIMGIFYENFGKICRNCEEICELCGKMCGYLDNQSFKS